MAADTLAEELRGYIKQHYKLVSRPGVFPEGPARFGKGRPNIGRRAMPGRELGEVAGVLSRFIKAERRRDTFAYTLNGLREERNMSGPDLYKAAWVDKRLYWKICNAGKPYKPAKDTALQFAFALKLEAEEFTDFLKNAGFALSDSSVRDLVFRFCVERGIFDLHDVNALLLAAEQKLLCKEPAGAEDV